MMHVITDACPMLTVKKTLITAYSRWASVVQLFEIGSRFDFSYVIDKALWYW